MRGGEQSQWALLFRGAGRRMAGTLGDKAWPLTHQRDPHAQRCPVDTEILQDVVTHEAEHRQAGPGAGVVELPENPQGSGAREDCSGAPGPRLGPSHAPPPARPLTSREAQASHFVPQYPHLKKKGEPSAPLMGSCGG